MTWAPRIESARRKCVMLAALALLLGVFLISANPARAATTFTVNSTRDAGDQSSTDNKCFTGDFVVIVGPGRQLVFEEECTLRAAIQQANATAGADTVNFSENSVLLSIAGGSEEAAATGDLDITDDVTIDGGSGVTIGAGPNFNDRIFHVVSPAKATIKNVTVSGGEETRGGGIYVAYGAKLDLSGSTISDNIASGSTGYPSGGGLYSAGTLTVTGSTLMSNTVSTQSGSVDVRGGGLANQSGTATVTDSAFYNNKAEGATTLSSYGGGILNDLGHTTLTNVTVSGNMAGYQGGGIYNVNPFSSLTLTNVTLNNNSAPNGANLYHYSGDTFSENTVVANPQGSANCGGSAVNTWGHNLEYPGTSCGFTGTGDVQHQDPKLGALGNHGGLSRTHELLSGSSAIDAADNTACPSTDQRGLVRPQDGDNDGTYVCDIGAFEKDGPPTVTGVVPAEGATGVSRLTNVTATFSEAMDPKTVVTDQANQTSTTITLVKGGPTSTMLVPAKVSCDDPCQTVTLDPFPDNPKQKLAKKRTYTVKISGAKDLAGNPLPDKTWSFKTKRR